MTRTNPAEAGLEQVVACLDSRTSTSETDSIPNGVQLSILDLPAVARVRQHAPDSSVAAARECAAPLQQRVILTAALRAPAPFTADDCEDRTGILRSTAASRLAQ